MKIRGKIKHFLTILYPSRCIICDKTISESDSGVCPECLGKIVLIGKDTCFKCGRPVREGETYCRECLSTRHYFDAGRFALSYESIAVSVYRFKYSDRPAYAETYARYMYDSLKDWIMAIKPDALIPVPLHERREIKRGYNQAAVLARELSKLCNVPVREDIAFRVRNTAPQKKFDSKQRHINMKKAFIVSQNDVKLSTVMVVDDIFTTGSTIDALSKEFRNAGISKIYFITITAAGT